MVCGCYTASFKSKPADRLTATNNSVSRKGNRLSLCIRAAHPKYQRSTIPQIVMPQVDLQDLVKSCRLSTEQVISLALADMPPTFKYRKHGVANRNDTRTVPTTTCRPVLQTLDDGSRAGLQADILNQNILLRFRKDQQVDGTKTFDIRDRRPSKNH